MQLRLFRPNARRKGRTLRIRPDKEESVTTAVAWMAPVCALIGICMAGYLGSWVLRQDPGPDKMNGISLKIQQGAKAFLMSEYKLLVIFMIVVAVVMAVFLSPITALAFVTGGVMSAAAGYVGMHVATRANTRTAHAAEESVAKALNISFKSGLTMGLCVASFALLGLSLWLIVMVFGMAAGVDINAELAGLMHTNIGMVEGFATGASAVALFAASTRRPPTWAPTSWARWKRAFPRTIRATRPPSPTTWATTWATSRAWAPTCSRATRARSSPPPSWRPPSARWAATSPRATSCGRS